MMLIGAGPVGAEVTRQGATVKSDAAWLELEDGDGFISTRMIELVRVGVDWSNDTYRIEAILDTTDIDADGDIIGYPLALGTFESRDAAREALRAFLSAADIMESA